MHLLLDYENDYTARIIKARFTEGTGYTVRGAKIRGARYIALNYELEVFDKERKFPGNPAPRIPCRKHGIAQQSDHAVHSFTRFIL